MTIYDCLSVASFIGLILLALFTLAIWHQVEREGRYIEFWMRSMESRKMDSPEVVKEREAMGRENDNDNSSESDATDTTGGAGEIE